MTLAGSVWLIAGARFGDGTLQPPRGAVPWGGVQDVLPRFGGTIGPGEAVVLAIVAVALAALVLRERRAWLQTRGRVEDGLPRRP